MRWRRVFLVLALVLFSAKAHAGGAFETYGDVAAIAIPAIAGAVAISHNDGEGLARLTTAYAVSVAVTDGLKRVVRRLRPDGSNDLSFPSGHATRAFAGASYLHCRYGFTRAIPAYIAAVAVAASRVDADKHHWSDVIAAALLAHAIACAVTEPLAA
jgi:membrane-associated phospholipid phosphatase